MMSNNIQAGFTKKDEFVAICLGDEGFGVFSEQSSYNLGHVVVSPVQIITTQKTKKGPRRVRAQRVLKRNCFECKHRAM